MWKGLRGHRCGRAPPRVLLRRPLHDPLGGIGKACRNGSGEARRRLASAVHPQSPPTRAPWGGRRVGKTAAMCHESCIGPLKVVVWTTGARVQGGPHAAGDAATRAWAHTSRPTPFAVVSNVPNTCCRRPGYKMHRISGERHLCMTTAQALQAGGVIRTRGLSCVPEHIPARPSSNTRTASPLSATAVESQACA